MHGGAVTLAEQFNKMEGKPDLILATSMLDFSTFLGLTKEKSTGIQTAIYFHENQLTYPWSPQDRDVKHKRDNHYAFMNYTSALVADRVFFNSEYHRSSFLEALPKFLNQFPDRQDKYNIGEIEAKSEVLYLGMDLTRFDLYQSKKENNELVILWNHRWEYDKKPEDFFEALFRLKDEGLIFKVIVLGEQNQMNPPIFDEAKERLKDQTIHWGFAQTFEEYAQLLWKADILPVTSNQDFFGGSVVEAMYCGCLPILPNRLAYPEHLTKDQYDRCLYENGDFYSKLREVVDQNTKESFKSGVEKYDWGNVSSDYDEMFLKFCS